MTTNPVLTRGFRAQRRSDRRLPSAILGESDERRRNPVCHAGRQYPDQERDEKTSHSKPEKGERRAKGSDDHRRRKYPAVCAAPPPAFGQGAGGDHAAKDADEQSDQRHVTFPFSQTKDAASLANARPLSKSNQRSFAHEPRRMPPLSPMRGL